MSTASDVVPALGERSLVGHLEAFRDFMVEHHATREGLHYQGDLDLVLREGRGFESVPWRTWHGRGYRRGPERQCFKNAHELAWRVPELTYVEGFATCGLLPVHHAWCSDAEGRVVDPTWREKDRRAVKEWEYHGIPLRLAWVDAVTFDKGTYGVLDTSAIYKQPLPEDAVVVLP